ncbi:MAG: OB-fold-containig protein [Candidatus Methylacidiphilales bacterium]|nr:OB-fold-containig protein [Candidatus Methylacidiphilales bacterium]
MPALWTFFSHPETAPWAALLILATFASVFSAVMGGGNDGHGHGGADMHASGDVDFGGGTDVGVHAGGDVHVGDVGGGTDLHAGGGDLHADVHAHAGHAHGHGDGHGHEHGAGGGGVFSSIGLDALGRLPVALTIGLMSLLTSSSSLFIQWIAWRSSGNMPAWWLAGLGGAAVTWSMLKIASPVLDRVVPRNHTEALGWDDMIGLEGEIVLGVARIGLPSEARVRDSFGRDHYLLVEPRVGAPEMPAGTRVVILVHKEGKHFLAVESSAGGTGMTALGNGDTNTLQPLGGADTSRGGTSGTTVPPAAQ